MLNALHYLEHNVSRFDFGEGVHGYHTEQLSPCRSEDSERDKEGRREGRREGREREGCRDVGGM